jgi:hypothetical protein
MSGVTRTRIPIPSFSTSLEKEEAAPSNTAFQEERYTNIPLNKQWLLQLEGALQLFLHQNNQKRQSISYSEFCALVPKLVLEDDDAPPHSSSTSENDALSSPVSNLSKEERLWHNWYCVAVPTLYKVVVHSSTLRVLELERVPFDGNRWKEARRLVEDTFLQGGVLKERSDEAIQMLQSLRSTDDNKVATKTKTKTTTQDDDSKKHKKQPTPEDSSIDMLLLKPEMTLEERVRARAERREKQLQKVEEARKDPKEDWLAVADVLFGHACHVLRKQQRFETHAKLKKQPKLTAPKSKVVTTKCVLTFHDVVRVLPDRSRQEITAILQGITQTCPGWMGWIDPKNKGKKTNGVPIISKRATVWIDTSDYKRVRAQLLNGESNKLQTTSQQLPPEVEEKTPTTTTKNPIPAITVTKQPGTVPTKLQSSSTAKRTAEAVHTTRHNKQQHAPNGKRTAAKESPQTTNKRLRVNPNFI